MARRKRTPEENARREKIRELLQLANVGSKNKDTDNSRNGHSSKTLRISFGDVEVSVPRDRKGEFAPRCCGKSDQHQPGHRGYFHCLYG